MGAQLMQEVVAYAETASCRRRFLLHYFGEEFEEENCQRCATTAKTRKKKWRYKDEIVARGTIHVST
jgi:ATP-dependent DNA helicase RecQ